HWLFSCLLKEREQTDFTAFTTRTPMPELSPMDDAERQNEIARLREQQSEAKARRADLSEELVHLAVRLREIRREFGNPFYYSHPENQTKGSQLHGQQQPPDRNAHVPGVDARESRAGTNPQGTPSTW